MSAEQGGCLCGKVRFNATDVEHHHHACHCGMCRRWSGGPLFAAQVGSLTVTAGDDCVRRYRSSDWAERAFCAECGTNLYYCLSAGDRYFVSVGAFDNAAPFRLTGEIYVDSQPGGYAFAGELERLTETDVIKAMGGEPPPAS